MGSAMPRTKPTTLGNISDKGKNLYSPVFDLLKSKNPNTRFTMKYMKWSCHTRE